MKKYLLIFIVALTLVMAAGGIMLYVMNGQKNVNMQNTEAGAQLSSADVGGELSADGDGTEASASGNATVTLAGLGGADAGTVSEDVLSEEDELLKAEQERQEMFQAMVLL